ncbi:hypothetical protein SCG7086_AP_00220 [Chlamydiales bacterium SCGC AG-110-P3]|nr:hypothetical protein SCG7086_AP_00220 [Chlamydiales bacterium SCGC AG-110-P3]
MRARIPCHAGLLMYALFTSSIDNSLERMEHFLWAAFILGGIGGAMSYAVGVKMGAEAFLLRESGSAPVC